VSVKIPIDWLLVLLEVSQISRRKTDSGVRAGVISAVLSAILSAVFTYALVARPAQQSSDKALAISRQDHREEQAFHGALSAREDAEFDVGILEKRARKPRDASSAPARRLAPAGRKRPI
jgi:hypothetical protein